MNDADASALRSVLIVGGGTAGWLSAAMLRAYLKAEELSVTVVESPEVPIIGVGEATVPPLVDLVRRLGIDESDMMRHCDATWKLGIRFDGWHGDDHRYWHPFGLNAGSVDGLPFFYFWVRHRLQSGATAFTDFSPNATLCERMRGPLAAEGPSPVIEQGFYAWHIDATRFAAYLQAICTARGVRHLRDTVTGVERGEAGITAVHCRDSGALSADLYLDCSGFTALLSRGALEVPWVDYGDRLLCDRAVAVALKPDRTYPPYTRAEALEAGWAWHVPLTRRTGCGYVFSSRHVDDEAAIDELRAHAGERLDDEPRLIAMRVGRRARAWQDNCVAAGLAAGFLEPLESTGIYLLQAGIEQLLRYFPDRHMNPALARRYNARMETLYDEVRDFIVLHYLLSGRNGAFWNDARAVNPGSRLREIMNIYDATGMVEKPVASVFPALSVQTLMAGNGRLPARPPAQAMHVGTAKLDEIFAAVRSRNAALVNAMLPHGECLARLAP